jgi:hypothetical protein
MYMYINIEMANYLCLNPLITGTHILNQIFRLVVNSPRYIYNLPLYFKKEY